jgi:hypothetical protein
MVVPVAQGEETANPRLVVSEKDEGREHHKEELRHAQGAALENHREESGMLFLSDVRWVVLRPTDAAAFGGGEGSVASKVESALGKNGNDAKRSSFRQQRD